ncbi:MAG: rRNA pseudouridine synthase [Gracilibacteraceae bacterium]|nr:rRNA pseudouridine synthase [Gracilibacteraceae bacterium]
MSTIQRIDRILSNMGYGTRKEVKKLISSGLVEIDGIIVKDSGQKAAVDSQEIKVGGKRVFYRDFIYIMMNKPKGVISSTEDRFNRTVIDLLSDEFKTFSPFPVGRLDKDTEGLLLLTNDGQLSHRLLSPQKHVPKTYMAKIAGRVSERDVEAFGRGIILEDGYKTMSSELEVLERGSISLVEVTIYEGKFHQVKRMFQAVGKEVVYLKRISMGELKLDEALEPGEYRELNEEEREILP